MLHLFATVFGVIFLAELPDKTALAAVVMAARHKAAPVLLGTMLALTVQSVIAVAAGALLAKLPTSAVHIGSGVVFAVCGVVMWFRRTDKDEDKTEQAGQLGFWRVFLQVFGVVFIAELGDLTQIGTAAFAARVHDWHSWLTIFVASTLALWAVAVIAVVVGNRAAKLLSPARMQKVAAVLFFGIGVYLTVSGVLKVVRPHG